MIKFTARGRDNTQLIGIGLSRANTARLLQGAPIVVDLRGLGVTAKIELMIMAGETEEAMYQQLEASGLVMPDPDRIHIDPDLGG